MAHRGNNPGNMSQGKEMVELVEMRYPDWEVDALCTSSRADTLGLAFV